MKRTPLNQVGKIGRINAKANRKIAQMWIDKGIEFCEVCRWIYEIEGKLDWECIRASSNAHRHPRIGYRSRLEMLWSFNQVIRACLPSHEYLDNNTKIKEAVFFLLRGPDEFMDSLEAETFYEK